MNIIDYNNKKSSNNINKNKIDMKNLTFQEPN